MQLTAKVSIILLIPIVCLLAGGTIFYYLLVHRFKEGLQYIVNKESKGRYAFDASEAEFSFQHRSILLKRSVLYTQDTTGANLYLTLKIPVIYFSLSSWKELLFHKKIIVDSLSIIEPSIDVHVRTITARKGHSDFHASDILNYLEKALAHFNVHSFSLKDAAFSYQQENMPAPLHGDHINLSVSNFVAVSNEDSHLLGSDNLSILLGPQHWRLPDDRHEISFHQLRFDSKDQRFELDSFSFSQKVPLGKATISLQADKFFFTSRHLPAIYQKEQLLLDSLFCLNPVLSIPGYPVEKPGADPSENIRLKNDLFNFINIKFIAVVNGELLLQDKEGRTGKATTRKTNLHIFNFAVHPAIDPYPTTDSIQIDLKNIGFLTRDSLYKLTIDEFSFHRNDAIFRQVKFGPVSPGAADKTVEFTAPSLLLRNINIVELMRRRLKASSAELRQPLIVLNDKQKASPTGNSTAHGNRTARLSSDKKLALFYRTLHHISELINTPVFNIIDGAAHYRQTGKAPLDATVKNLDAHILLNKFFVSDSLVDIKHAIPDLRIGKMNLVAENTTISADQFWFNGVRRHSLIREVNITTSTGLQLQAENIYWNILDWDIYQKNKDIQIDSLYASRLTIHAAPVTAPSASAAPSASTTSTTPTTPSTTPSTPSPPRANLPIIRITRLQADQLFFDRISPNNSIRFTLNHLQAANLSSVNQFLTWTNLKTNLANIEFENPNLKTSIREADLNSDSGLLIKDLRLQTHHPGSAISLYTPVIRLNTTLSSTDLSRLPLAGISTDRLNILYNKITEKDTLKATAAAKISITGLRVTPGGSPRQITPVGSPRQITSGGSPRLSAAIDLAWKEGRLNYKKDSTALSLDDLSGSFKTDDFHWSPLSKIDWRDLAANLTLSKGTVHYQDKKISASIAACAWDPASHSLRLGGFDITPNENLENTFSKAQWQRDYIQVKGEKLTLSGILFPQEHQPFSLRLAQISVDSLRLSASRDKRMPFRHGLEKPMPTKLINTIPFPVKIDSLSIHSAYITYNECSVSTGRWSSIPIRDINGTILHLQNQDNQRDTLQVTAAGRLFDGHIRHFSYRESYGDSLSSFSASTWFSAIDLTQFSQVSIPAAAVSITGGHADTAWSSWQGNKYATFGTMNFWYKKLHIKVLNKTDSTKRGFLPTVETWLANLILPTQRKKSSAIFVERDREKFVFNYWVKAQTSGLLSTLGLKSSKSYLRQYQRLKAEKQP
jgi:hypothetical protein